MSNFVDAEPITFHTANGNVRTDKAVWLHIDALDIDLAVYVLHDSLLALSAGMLCRDNGCKINWSPGSAETIMHDPKGRRVDIVMRGACPWLSQHGSAHPVAAPGGGSYQEGGGEGSGEPPPGEGAPAPAAPQEPVAPAPAPEEVPPPPAPAEEERESKEARLRKEAKSLLHKMCHMPKNRYCAVCNATKIKAAQAKRRDPQVVNAPRRFGDLVLGDHVVMPNDPGSCGEHAGLLLKDKGHDLA